MGGTCVHSLRSSLLKQEEDDDGGQKALVLLGQRKQGGKRLFLLAFGYGREQQSIYVSKIYILAAQSFPFKVRASQGASGLGGLGGSRPP